ncbi:NACHT domain-containing protein [Actinokineospora soli]|uniref:NACHT domain-containing protein n=1 Tax=Actinokineospora soli TaxID=1048753 RepID=A0ABW2TS56_9PSEU
MTTRAFVSYAHESEEHIAAVRRFVSFLRTQGGIDARYDLAAEHERPDWPVWMAEQTRLADFVLVVASRAYRERADRLVPHDEGRGVQYEAAIMRELSYQNRPGWRGKVLPVVLPGQSRDGVPDFLLPYSSTVYHVTSLTVAGAEPLLRVLLDRPRHVPEPIGPAPVLAPVPTSAPLTEARYRRVRTRYAEEVADAWRSIRMDNLGDAGDPGRIVRLPLAGLHVALHADAEPDFQRARTLLGQRAADRGGDGGTVEERIGALVERGGKLRDATLAGTEDPTADAGVPLADAVARHRVLVVRGAPGSGKTVLCQRLGAELAEELKRGGDRVPLRVRLADYAAAHADALAAGGAPGPLPEFVARSVPVPGASPAQVAAMLTAALERGRAVVLLDGLDEVGAHREAVLEAVVEFDGRYPGNRLLVTSRVAGYAAAPLPLPDAAHYLIRPMAGPQIGAFVRNFFREVYADATRAEALLAELAEPHRAAALDLASTPCT